MPDHSSSDTEFYQIRLQGQMDGQWTDWFEGLSIALEENGDTLLTGAVADQAALHGLLKKYATWECHFYRSFKSRSWALIEVIRERR
jgi:hypothetical protein